jgi:hypothetical protein
VSILLKFFIAFAHFTVYARILAEQLCKYMYLSLQKMQDMLKNAWDAEGSPFKGQPFDPSKFSMDESGVVNMKPS